MYLSRCFAKSFLPVASTNDDIVVVDGTMERRSKNERKEPTVLI